MVYNLTIELKGCDCIGAKRKNLIRQRFGKLIVVDRTKEKNRVVWICKCDCGKIKKTWTSSLTSGETWHCGCQTSKSISEGKLQSLVGQRFGKLTVIEKMDNHITSGGQSKVMYQCRCDCGKKLIVTAGKLKAGETTHCPECVSYDYEDFTGRKIGKLTVIERTGYTGKNNNRIAWRCVCDCGTTIIKSSSDLKYYKGEILHCGCLRGMHLKDGHMVKHEKSNTDLYQTYSRMKSRCYYEKSQDYADYGGRGIKVCDEWLGENGFENFYNWSMQHGYSRDLSIDRIDVNGNYEPSNCRWADDITQANNRRNNHILVYGGKEQTIAEWAREYDISYTMLYQRIRRGWSVEDALITPNLGRG